MDRNPLLERLLGYTHDEMIGRAPWKMDVPPKRSIRAGMAASAGLRLAMREGVPTTMSALSTASQNVVEILQATSALAFYALLSIRSFLAPGPKPPLPLWPSAAR